MVSKNTLPRLHQAKIVGVAKHKRGLKDETLVLYYPPYKVRPNVSKHRTKAQLNIQKAGRKIQRMASKAIHGVTRK